MEEQKQDIVLQQQDHKQGFKALILGASGAIGRVLTNELCASSKWAKVSVIVRRKLPQWDTIPGHEKLDIILQENLDDLEQTDKWSRFQGYDQVFCTLGSRTGNGETIFRKVDYWYCLWGAQVAKKFGVRHYMLLTSVGADASSCFLYTRVKGEVERDITNLKIPVLSIVRPGFLNNRDNDERCGEKLLACIKCCMPYIEATDLGKSLRLEAEYISETVPQNETEPKVFTYNNAQIENFAKQNGK